MYAPPIPDEPEIYPPFAPPLEIQDHNYNGDWDVNGHKTVGDRLMEIRRGIPGTRVSTPYNPPLPLICDIDQDIFHTLYVVRERTCTIVEDGTSTFFTTAYAPIPNQKCVAPERHMSSVCGGTLYLYRKRDCPLSNTFPALLTWRGMEFRNVVMCVQAMKACEYDPFFVQFTRICLQTTLVTWLFWKRFVKLKVWWKPVN